MIEKLSADDLGKLFVSQLETLRDRGCPKAIMKSFESQRNEVLTRSLKTTFIKGHILFLPVIPRTYRSIYDQMPMIRSSNGVGYTNLCPYEIYDVVEISRDPYYIFSIENGLAMLDKSSEEAEEFIKKQARRCLTEVEIIALAIHTDVLSGHLVDAMGSRHESNDVAPYLCLYGDGVELDSDYIDGDEFDLDSHDDFDKQFGSPSCDR